MNLAQWSAITMQAGLIALAGTPGRAAEGQLPPSPDIVGLSLSTTRNDALAFVQQHYSGAQIVPFRVGLNTGDFQKGTTGGFIADIAAAGDQAANAAKTAKLQQDERARAAVGLGGPVLGQVGDFAADRLKILFDPNDGASDIFGISHYQEYAAPNQPLTKTVIDSLSAKYGEPTRSGGDSRFTLTYTWMMPGFLHRSKASPMVRCYDDNGTEILYENVGVTNFYGMRQERGFAYDGFIRTVNAIASGYNFANYKVCGTVLQAHLKLIKGGAYVGALGVTLLDFSRAYDELSAYVREFQREADAAKAKRMQTDSSIKPKL